MLLDRLAGPGFHGGTAPPLLPGLATIDRYVLRKAIAPLLAGTVVVLLALLLERLLRLLDLVVNKGSPISLIFKLLLNLTPHYIGIALPAAFFLAMLVAVHRLSTDSELDALQSFGLGLQRLLAPLTGVAILLMVLMIVVTGYVQPYSRYAYRALIYAITHGEGIIKVTGEVGSGKTMLCRVLQARLPKSVETVYLANPSVSPEEIMHAIAFELQLPIERGAGRLVVMHALNEYLVARHAEQGWRAAR